MIHFISINTAIKIHDILITSYGGLQGIRDEGLLLSALEMPKACFGGEDLHPTLFDKAAAYLYHISRNHPFIDGNKRTAAALALTFLDLNRVKYKVNMQDYEELVISAATGQILKQQLSDFFERSSVLSKRERSGPFKR